MAADDITSEKQSDREIRRTVLILGASNVSLAWSEIVSLACRTTSGPVNLVTAQGMGRAYVSPSSGFAFWRLPGILKSGLWDVLNQISDDPSPSVLLTDLGNDLLYGRSADEVVAGASECVERIRAWRPGADVVVTSPPLDSVLNLGAVRFQIVKRLLFPFSSLSLSEVKDATTQLSQGVSQLAEVARAKLFTPSAGYFGLDPIHIRKRFRKDAFRAMFDLWEQPPCLSDQPVPCRRVVPQERLVFGRERVRRQPAEYSDRLKVFAY